MANNPSAKKRNRQRQKRRIRNMQHLVPMRTRVKRARHSLSDTKATPENVQTSVAEAVAQVAKAAQKGVIHKRTASRKISRLVLALNKAAVDRKSATSAAPKKAAKAKSAAPSPSKDAKPAAKAPVKKADEKAAAPKAPRVKKS